MSEILQMYEDAYSKRAEYIDGYLLFSQPRLTVLLTAIYLILATRVFPKFMAKRQPFNIRALVISYNALQVALCSYFVCRSVAIGWMWNYGLFNLVCDHDAGVKDPSVKVDVAELGHMFYVLKFLEWSDTFIFLAKKKTPYEFSVMVFHHAVMPLMCVISIVFAPAGHFLTTTTLISFQHIFIYVH